MHEAFLLNEKLKEELVKNCQALYAHTTWHPDGLNSIPFIIKIIGQNTVDDTPYYETVATWPSAAEEENIENALNCIDYYCKKINKVAVMTDVIEEEDSRGIYFTWAIFLDKNNDNNAFDLG